MNEKSADAWASVFFAIIGAALLILSLAGLCGALKLFMMAFEWLVH